MIPDQYVWLTWSLAFLVPWAIIYWRFPAHRHAMRWTSLYTMPFGLSEPLFVPEYWSPPSLFDLARTTGFDIESLIFCFGIGGTGSVLYNLITQRVPQPLPAREKAAPLHRHHYKALAAPFVAFPVLLGITDWNPIWPAIAALFIGALANVWCRPDLKFRTWIGGMLFIGYYALFLVLLEWSAPGYIERVWNLGALSGWRIGFIPVEELLFAAGFGMYWAGVYEHYTWKR